MIDSSVRSYPDAAVVGLPEGKRGAQAIKYPTIPLTVRAGCGML